MKSHAGIVGFVRHLCGNKQEFQCCNEKVNITAQRGGTVI